MIVLGPHIVNHQFHHVLTAQGDDDDAAPPVPRNTEKSIRRHLDYGTQDHDAFDGNNKFSTVDQENTERSVSHATLAESPPEDRHVLQARLEARLEVSKLLGSIGFPLPASSVDFRYSGFVDANETLQSHQKSEDVTNINTAQYITNEESVQNYFDCIVELAMSHTSLLQTIQSCLHVLTIGTGLRLGIGPKDASRRAERAWLARKLRQRNTTGVADEASYPKLTFYRCRQILHNAIVDQTTSLQNLLSRHGVNFDGITDWGDFIHDLRHTMDFNCVLTLSQLTKWTDSLGKFLGNILSQYLTQNFVWRILEETNPFDLIRATISSSVQMAKERIVFLQTAFSLSPSGTSHAHEDILAQARENPGMQNLIDTLKFSLDRARVSLWAFEEALTRSDKSEWRNWFGELNDLVDGSSRTMRELDNLLLSSEGWASNEERTDAIHLDININEEHHTLTPSAMLVSNGTHVDEETNPSDEIKHSLPLDKTLIFTGNGSHKRPQIRKAKAARNTANSQNVSQPQSFDTFNHTILLRDLQSRLKTFGLADEFEVVTASESPHRYGRTNRVSQTTSPRANLPIFLGVSGSALAELSSVIGSQGEEQIIIE